MRILYLTPTDSFSGGERVTLDIAVEMRARGHEVVYCGVEGPIRGAVEAAGVRFYGFPRFTPKTVLKAAADIAPELIHTMDYRASTFAALTGVPFIAHLHNDAPWLGGLGPNSWAMRFFGARAAHILTVSESVMREYRFGSSLANKTTVLGNTVDIGAVRKASEAAAAEELLPFTAPSPDVLFFGRLSEPKDPLRFVGIFAALKERLPELSGLMIGDGELREAVEAAVRDNGLSESLRLTGFTDVPFPLVRRARLLIMPSKWEGFGLTCVESMALGLPCLVSPVGGLRTIVPEDWVCRDDASFIDKAEHLLTDSAAYRAASAAAAGRAVRYGDRKRYFDTVEQISLDAVNGRRRK